MENKSVMLINTTLAGLKRRALSSIVVASFTLAACGGGGGGGPKPTWTHCDEITPQPALVVPAVEATETMKQFKISQEDQNNPFDLSCVPTNLPIVAATETGTPPPPSK